MELWKAHECTAQDGRTERNLVVQEHAAVSETRRIYSQWLEDDNKQKVPKRPHYKLSVISAYLNGINGNFA